MMQAYGSSQPRSDLAPPRAGGELEQAPRQLDIRANATRAHVVHVQYPPDSDFDTHEHESSYLCLVTLGSFVEWRKRQRRIVRSGAEVVYTQGSKHAVRTGPRGASVLHITDPVTEDWQGESPPHRLGILWQIHRAIKPANDRTNDADALHLDSLVSELRLTPRTDNGSWLTRSRIRIRDGYRERLDLVTLSREASVHPSHFARAFRKRYGMTAGEFLRRTRVAAAVRRLSETNLPPSVVALETGFADQSHMGRSFRRYLGRTPHSFRRMMHDVTG